MLVRPETRPPIGQALALDARKGLGGAVCIAGAKGGAVVVPEIELAKVAVQVLLAAMMIDALQAALEHRKEEAFNGVRMNVATDVFLGAVIDGRMVDIAGPVSVLLSLTL